MVAWTYPTVKYVQIQDSRLVILRYFLLLIIASYVGIFELWCMGGWLDSVPVVGVVRFSLQQPTVDNCDPTLAECENAFVPLDTLPYCAQSYDNNATLNSSYPGIIYPCEVYEAINAQVVNENSLTIITRASTIPQKFVCPSKNPNTSTCPKTYENTGPEYKFYTAQTESFTILVDHAVTASKICTRHQDRIGNYACSAESSSHPGRLYSKNDALCRQEHTRQNAFQTYRGSKESADAPCYLNPNKTKTNQDFFSLEVLLQAADITLDDCSSNASSYGGYFLNDEVNCQTYRDSGATLLLNIHWSDFSPYEGLVEPHYYYSPQLVGTSFKQYVPYYDNHYRQSRTLLNAHGIRVAVLLGGEFNEFNVVNFMVTLTTALGLLAVATTIVDTLMLYILPEKKRYQEVKYEMTEAFESNDVVTTAVAGLSRLIVSNSVRDDHNEELESANRVNERRATEETLVGSDADLTDPLLPTE